ncbi:MAG TPA: tyrosine-protein phosphatase [Clostridia bacterium]|nr:tyrosine-protein phosphatase [Clostridia bacterium]
MIRNRIAVSVVIAAIVLNIAGCTAKTDVSVSSLPTSSTSVQAKAKSTLPHSLGLSGVENARDLGGYRTADGKTVKMGVLLRTAALEHATANDIRILTEQYHLAQIIDFRTVKGARENPDPVINGVTETNLPIHPSTKQLRPGENSSYVDMVTNPKSISAFRQFFTILLSHKNRAVLFHCAAGKDRTGIASILLLSALNVDENTIIQDYLLSNEYHASVEKDWAMTALHEINSRYGSMDAFLNRELGLTPQDRIKLQAMYLQ